MPDLLTRRSCLQLTAAALAAATLPLLPAHAADAGGRYEALDFEWTDTARRRAVPVRLYLPEATDAAAASAARSARPAPLVVFSHGIGGSRYGYAWLGQHVAAHGIASLHVQHVGSDRQIWTGNMWSTIGKLQDAASEREAVARTHDLRFALDTLLAGELAPLFDPSRIVAAGHSYGANTALLASGAMVRRHGRALDLHDPRVRAAIVISAPPFYGEDEPRKILSTVAVPSLHITATDDVIRIPGYYSGAEDRVAVYDATGGPQGPQKWLAVFNGGSHSMFTDRGGAAFEPRLKSATQALVLAFVREVFDGDDAALKAWSQRYAALLARFADDRARAGAAQQPG